MFTLTVTDMLSYIHVQQEHVFMIIYRYSAPYYSCDDLPESDGQWNGIYHSIDLKHTDEECSKVLKHLSKEIPKQPEVGSQVRNSQSKTSTDTG